jgi:hypothetical protein
MTATFDPREPRTMTDPQANAVYELGPVKSIRWANDGDVAVRLESGQLYVVNRIGGTFYIENEGEVPA